MVWYRGVAWAHSHISPTLLQKDKTQTSPIRVPNHYLRQDSKKPAPGELLLTHTGERKTRIPDTKDEGLVKPGAYIDLTVHVLSRDGGLVNGWCMGSHLNTKSQCCQSLKQNSFSGVDCFSKTRQWEVEARVQKSWNLGQLWGLISASKHCSAYIDCFGKTQESFLCTTRNLPNDIYCVS